MMASFVLSCCSTTDLSAEYFTKRDISYICFHYSLNGKQYMDDFGKSVSYESFYKAMSDGASTSTTQVNVDEFLKYFKAFLEQGLDILHICLSSGLSGTYNSANIAANELLEQFPDRKIYIVDSLGASSGYGLLVDTVYEKKESGMSIDELYKWTLQHRLMLHHWFFSTDLTYYVRGGRVSKTSGMVGTILNICPLLNMDREGRLIPRDKIRGKKRVITEIVARMERHVQDGYNYDGKCFISHSNCYEDARKVADLIESKFPKLNGGVLINSIGTTIGSHTGPGTVALFFWGKMRAE